MSKSRRRGGRNWKPPSGRTSRQNRRRARDVGNYGLANVVAEEVTTNVPAASSQTDEVVSAASLKDRFSWGSITSAFWRKARAHLGGVYQGRYVEEPDPNAKLENKVATKLAHVLAVWDGALEEGDLDKVKRLREAYTRLQEYYRENFLGVESTT